MTHIPAAVLHLEDSDLDAEFVANCLGRAAVPVTLDRVGNRAAFEAKLREQRYDLILADYRVPGLDGVASLDLAKHIQPDTPFVFLSGAMGEDFAVETLHRGAADYVLKERLLRLPAVVERAIAEGRERLGRQAAQEAAARAEARAVNILESLSDAFFALDADWYFTYVNAAFEQMTGAARPDTLGRRLWALYPDTVGTPLEANFRRVAAGTACEFEYFYPSWGRWFAIRAYPADGGGMTAQVREVTAAKRAERKRLFLDELNQSARMATDPTTVMRTTTRLLGEYLGVTRCAYADVDADGDRFTIRDDWTAAGAVTTVGGYSLDLFGPRAAADMRAGRTLVIRDVDAELADTAGADTFRAIGIRAIVCCPLVKDGRLAAMMAVHHADPRDWTAEEIAVTEEVVERSWAHIERVRDEIGVREARDRLALALSAGQAGTFTWDMVADVNRWSPELEDLYGIPRGSFEGTFQAWAKRVVPEDAAAVEAVLRRCLAAREEMAEYEFRAVLPDGRRRWLAGRGRFTFDAAGTPVRMAGVNVDIEARKQAEEALKEADRRKDEFLATLAHELRNPLAPLRTGLQVLKLAGPVPPPAVRATEMMERQLGHMVRLVDDLLDVSRVSRGKIELKKQPVTVRAVVEAAVETSRPVVENGRHDLRVDLPAEDLPLFADPTRLAQVVSNLLTNAAKYTPDGGRIALSAERAGDAAVIRVRDNGTGIPAEMLSRVFDLFTQVGHSLDRSQGGLGIGLSLVRKLVEMHDGSVVCESEGLGRGSTFSVRLPLAATAAGPAPAADGKDGHAAAGRRVLVVDDNVDGAESLSLLLSLAGHDTRVAHDGPAALDAARQFRPEVVFLDIGLPGLSGYEVADRLRRDASSAFLVALTGWGTDDDKQRATAAGFDLHLTKPVEAATVADVLVRFNRRTASDGDGDGRDGDGR